MSAGNSTNFAHNQAINLAEGVRQAAVAAASSQATVRSAEITFHRAVIASCFANNSSAGLQPSMQALRDLGGVSWK